MRWDEGCLASKFMFYSLKKKILTLASAAMYSLERIQTSCLQDLKVHLDITDQTQSSGPPLGDPYLNLKMRST